MFQRRRRTAAPITRLDPKGRVHDLRIKSECQFMRVKYRQTNAHNIMFAGYTYKVQKIPLSTRLHYRRTAQSPLPWSSAGGNNPAFPFAAGCPFCPCCSRCSLRILSTILVRMYNKREITRHSRINRTVSPNSSVAPTSSRSRPRTPSK